MTYAKTPRVLLVAAAITTTLATGCVPEVERDAEPNEVVVTSREFSFALPDTLPAGLTRLRLRNDGQELHHLQLVRLGDGFTIADLNDSFNAGNFTATPITYAGGPNVAPPGLTSEVLVNLTPGRYAIVCFIPSPEDGIAHRTKGMAREIVVTGSAPALSPPAADVELVLDDYSFTFTPAISAGRHTIRVINAAQQPHEIVLVRLLPGRTIDDLHRFVQQRVGPPPFEPVGGTLGLSKGEENYMTSEFTPGDYVALCFVPDAADGKPHVAHGMLKHFRVD
jgi:hypothetical protein